MTRLLVPLLVIALAPSAEARCARSGLEPAVIGELSALPAGAGVVVGYANRVGGALEPGDVAVRPTWRFRAGRRSLTPKIEPLAPGLAVYRLPDGPRALTLVDGKRTIGKISRSKAAHRALAAPRATRVVHTTFLGRRGSRRVTVELAAAAPDTAVALVIVDARGKAMTWGKVAPGTREVVVYASGHCNVLPNETVRPMPGAKVTLFWVDNVGVRSPASRPIAVVE